MTSFIPLAVESSRTLAYRAVEVEQTMKKNMLVALGISILIHAVIVASYYLFPTPAINLTDTEWNRSVVYFPPSFTPQNFVPQNSAGGSIASDMRLGKVVPIPDEEANLNLTLATPGEMKKGIASAGTFDGEGKGDSRNGGVVDTLPVDIPEAEPDTFVPVERQPILVRRVSPQYPELLVKAGVTGRVWVKIWVNKQGKPHEVRILKSDNELFNEAAVEAAKRFLFTPAYMNNGPVSVWVSVPFSFKLR